MSTESDTVTAIVVPNDTTPRAEALHADDPTAPTVGRWYYVQGKSERWLGCVVHIGTNYARLKGVRWSKRVHLDHFWDVCTFEPDPDMVIAGHVGAHQQRVQELMEEVREVTMRLGVGQQAMLTAGSEAQAITLRRNEPMDAYKKALVKAKDKTLPALFEEIKGQHAALEKWMSARLIPLKAQAAGLKPAIKSIEDRIFSVQLYAGLTEEIKQIADGEPAPMTEKIHLFQRRAYMDEECLAFYESGGMDFKSLAAFDRWLVNPKRRDRILPFPRCIIAFQVRRYRKERRANSLADIFRIAEEEKLDRRTFLYMRNGEQMFRLSTEIEFDRELFPDVDERELLTGKLWANVNDLDVDEDTTTFFHGGDPDDTSGNRVATLIPDRRYQGMLEDERAAYAKWRDVDVPAAQQKIDENKKKPEDKQQHFLRLPNEPTRHSENYSLFNRDNIHYDDIANYIQKKIASHNRLVLVLQGILDRSPVMHPHPPWILWNPDSFGQALELIYDSAYALTPGDAPDFEAFRARLNASITTGTVTLGQQRAWNRASGADDEGGYYVPRRDRHERRRWRDEDNHGPGKFARVVKVVRGRAHFQWLKTHTFYREGEQIVNKYGCKIAVPIDKLFNLDAYTPGDFHQFFDDPRTREKYLQWAPMLIEAEEYKAGKREVAPTVEMPPPRQRTPGGSYEYRERKRKLALVGKAVRLKDDTPMKRGGKYKKGSLWRVTSLQRGGVFYIEGINKDGTPSENDDCHDKTDRRGINGMREYSFTVDDSIPPDPEVR